MNSFTKRYTYFLFILIIPFSIVQAQDNNSTSPLQSGSKALQFQISDNFNLDSFSGTTFSYKEQLSNIRARRVGFSFGSIYEWRNYPDDISREKDLTQSINFGINYTLMNYTNPDSDIKFFYGYGPGVNLGFVKNVQEETNGKSTEQYVSYGIAGVGYAGVEWFFQSSMSLHAEYRASVRVNHIRDKRTNENEEINNTNSTRIRLGGDGIRFGLSVYF